MRFHAQSPDRKTGKTSAVFNHIHQMTGRYRFGLGHTVNIDELGEHVLNAILDNKVFCGFRCHGCIRHVVLLVEYNFYQETYFPFKKAHCVPQVSHQEYFFHKNSKSLILLKLVK